MDAPADRTAEALPGLPDWHLHRPHALHEARHDIAGRNWADPLGRAGHDDVAGAESISRRGIFDQLGDIEDERSRIRRLPKLAVDVKRQVELTRIRDFIGGHQPRTKNAERVK